ncbi:zinc-finger associated domain containing protein [Oryctes borbonicus]|uniref:Zinc-finger associated domain containing protein n=1 Tax=Oryctes borbonicus TaxID=1629725 RepID=A0A0T6B9S3_9SCAR|nr:zinc-finger associated domain containing protein [Oryctes borbonicus]
METKLCRICGKSTDNHFNIFKTEGLKIKLETCLPIVVSQHCLLPDTICKECTENVESFYTFIKNCLENLIILESQYDIHESCLKSKRKFEKGTIVDRTTKTERGIQTDEISFIGSYKESILNFPRTLEEAEKTLNQNHVDYSKYFPKAFDKDRRVNLVSYDVSEESNSENEDSNTLSISNKIAFASNGENRTSLQGVDVDNFLINKQYFDNQENRLINEITQRLNQKRKCDEILPYRTKICKYDFNSRRKNRQPKKISNKIIEDAPIFNQWNQDITNRIEAIGATSDKVLGDTRQEERLENANTIQSLPQVCLLCESQFPTPAELASHVFETHGIDMAQILASEPVMEKKKKIPNLVKIADLKNKSEISEPSLPINMDIAEEPPTLQPSYACPICPALLTNKTDLYTHLRVKHAKQASLTCGLCTQLCNSCISLSSHLETCTKQHPLTSSSKYICKVCRYSDDNSKTLENHIVVHDFILQYCRKQSKIFDPSDYIELNPNSESSPKIYTCNECTEGVFDDFKEFSAHRRSQHQIFHCDLCNKFYGRNSHLWKHVNRLHKGHPSITCQLCHKTSASKYHLAQHFSKIHSAKLFNSKPDPTNDYEDFMKQKFQGFDFQSVKQSFMRQEMLKHEQKDSFSEISEQEEENEKGDDDEKNSEKEKGQNPPKEIDSSSNLYTNIITNYTPPQNNGEFKCPKCLKGFHKKNLLKKHKKNCRPRLQKDLLTRCKTCSRIFKDRQSLTKHLINYHSEYVCEICSQKFQSKCEIVSHIRFTHPNCHLFCSCGNILRNKEDLRLHKQDHWNSFICQFCADSLPTKIKLKMHILSLHRKILSLSCGICLKLFETQHILRDHVRLVHKEHLLPLTSCTVCGKNYGSKWKTFDHLNKSHGRIFKPCKVCLEVFDSEEQLQKHYDTMHITFSQSKSSIQSTPSNEFGSIKKELCESDFEHNYENEDKNSNSDVEDAENYSGYQNMTQSDYDERTTGSKIDYSNTMDEGKISLLEKRLLGKKLPSEEQKKSSKKIKNDKKMEYSVIFPTNNTKQREFDDIESNQSPLQNSSKRTVYVNSNDPSLCEICLKTWPAKKHLWQHYIRCHKTVAATVCGICLKANESYESLQKHLRENHPTLLHGQGFGSNFICRICGRYHNASSKLKLHMAIHENFDWKILESFENTKADHPEIKIEDTLVNGYDVKEEEEEEDEAEEDKQIQPEINFESLIEEVECSSESENENVNDSEDEDQHGQNEDTSTSDPSDSDDVSEENSLESQMLQNMLIEKNMLQKQVDAIKNNNGGTPYKTETQNKIIPYDSAENGLKVTSSETEDSNSSSTDHEHDNDEYKSEIKSENGSSEDEDESQISIVTEDDEEEEENRDDSNDSSRNVFETKPEELDSAIKSISYEEENNLIYLSSYN